MPIFANHKVAGPGVLGLVNFNASSNKALLDLYFLSHHLTRVQLHIKQMNGQGRMGLNLAVFD